MTKITSTFTFLLTIAFLLYQKQAINWGLTLLFFAGMFMFDLTTTAINNYIDTKNNHQTLQFKRRTALIIIYVLFTISTALGLYLAYLTDIVVLLTGGLCFLCGVFYTYGPVPISRTPLGELLSGFFYGMLIPFIMVYINTPAGTYLTFDLNLQELYLRVNIRPFISLFLLSVIPFATTANIMLAKYLRSGEGHSCQKAYPALLYRKKSFVLFAALYTILPMQLLYNGSDESITSCMFIITDYHNSVQANIIPFSKAGEGKQFLCAIKNFIIINGANTLMIFIGVLLTL
jgi:1,4-dihydroxy-2-naphthoate octaprenyltransferase